MSETQQSGQQDPNPDNIPGHEDGVGIGATSEADTTEPEEAPEGGAGRSAPRERPNADTTGKKGALDD